jgi:hypothetical protein
LYWCANRLEWDQGVARVGDAAHWLTIHLSEMRSEASRIHGQNGVAAFG